MAIGDLPGSVPGATYNGFSGPPVKATDQEKRRRTIILAGVVGALGLGVLAGALARPDVSMAERREMEPVRQTPSGPELAIQVDPAKPPPAPPPVTKSERLEVLPAELAKAAPKPPPVIRTAYRERAPTFDEAPIDCSAPADRHEARICRDIGFSDEAPPLDIPPPDEGDFAFR